MARTRTMFRLDSTLATLADELMPYLKAEAREHGVLLETRNSALEWMIHTHINETQRRIRIAQHMEPAMIAGTR